MKLDFDNKRPLITPILTETGENGLINEISDCITQGADAFCLQIERLPQELRAESKLKKLFAAMGDKVKYVTCYLKGDAVSESEDDRAKTLLNALYWGADIADVRGDAFAACDSELTFDETAVEKQKELIKAVHRIGKRVLMSSHVRQGENFVFLSKEEVLKIALEHERRGADVSKIVTNADTEAELNDNFETIIYCRKRVKIPVLFLCNGKECARHRMGGGLIYEPIVFAKEKSRCPIGSPQQPIEEFFRLFEKAGFDNY